MNELTTESNTETNKLNRNKNHIWGGLFLLAIGAVLLLKQLGIFFPAWLFSWPMLLVAIGIYIGLRQGFKGGVWIILILIGLVFLSDDLLTRTNLKRYIWPIALIAAGLWMVFRPKKSFSFSNSSGHTSTKMEGVSSSGQQADADHSDYVVATTILGGVKKNVLSKNFKGGEIVNFMGGTELNLMQADIPAKIRIEATNIFGGTKLIIPSTWDVQSEVVAIFGGVDDKRQFRGEPVDQTKVIFLEGTCLFGGIEIRSY